MKNFETNKLMFFFFYSRTIKSIHYYIKTGSVPKHSLQVVTILWTKHQILTYRIQLRGNISFFPDPDKNFVSIKTLNGKGKKGDTKQNKFHGRTMKLYNKKTKKKSNKNLFGTDK